MARASSSSITEIAKPTWIRTQSPGPMSSKQPDVDGAPDSGNVDLGELVGLVDDFHDLAGDGQAHVVALLSVGLGAAETELYHSARAAGSGDLARD